MRRSPGVRLAALALLAALLWVWMGAPLTEAEWQDVPSRFERALRQAAPKTAPVWRNWLCTPFDRTSRQAQEGDVLSLRVWDADKAAVRVMGLEDYVRGVVAAEMPVSYSAEALKCQAVAARTRAVWSCLSLGGSGCAAHPGSDVCTDSACCQGWCSEAAQRDKWADAYDQYALRVQQAVRATAGEILTYDGLPAQVLYHACSGGRTEDAAAVFAKSVPYLVQVDSPGEETFSRYATTVQYTRQEAAARLAETFPACGVTAQDLPGQLELRASTASGRASRLRLGTQEVAATDFRRALSLGSTCFTWEADDDTITFHVRGSGHGVGMSQAGAQAMASGGSDYRAILAHYYPGTCLATLPDGA